MQTLNWWQCIVAFARTQHQIRRTLAVDGSSHSLAFIHPGCAKYNDLLIGDVNFALVL
jgi:hypothetical protein